jgi:hypothetical protein
MKPMSPAIVCRISLGRVVGGRVLVHRFGHSDSNLFFHSHLAQVTKFRYGILKTLFHLGTTFPFVYFV